CDLEPGRLRADEDVAGRSNARRVDERPERHVNVRTLPHDREQQRAAGTAARVVQGLLADEEEVVRAVGEVELLALDPGERLDRGAGRGAAPGAVAVRGVEELVRDRVPDGAALASAVESDSAHSDIIA